MKKILLFTLCLIFTALLSNIQAQSVWVTQTSGTTEDLDDVDFFSENTGIAVGNAGTILTTLDGGENWQPAASGTSSDLFAVSYVDSLHAVAVGASGTLVRTQDGGATWEATTVTGISADLLGVDILPGGQGIACGRLQTILWTEDGGSTWRILRYDWFGTFYAAQMLDDQTGFVYGENSLMNHLIGKVTQPGDVMDFTFFYIILNGILTEGTVYDGYFFDQDSSVTVGAIFPGSATITHNQPWGNSEWNYVFFREASYLNGVDFYHDHGIAVGGAYDGSSAMIVESLDNGATWSEVEVGSDKTGNNTEVRVLENVAYVVGEGGKILKQVPATGISGPGKNALGVRVYPNPADDHVNFTVAQAGAESLTIWITNPQGQVVREKSVKPGAKGDVTVTLPLNGLAPGCYLYKVISEMSSFSGKIIVY